MNLEKNYEAFLLWWRQQGYMNTPSYEVIKAWEEFKK